MSSIHKPESLFDCRSQITENCEFITHKEDYINVILSKEPTGGFKAYVTRATDISRSVLLASETTSDAQGAYNSLLEKSCEATHQYITTNGFEQPPNIKNLGLDGEDDDDASSITDGSSAASDAMSDVYSSEDEDIGFPTPESSCRPGGKPIIPQAKPRRTRSEQFHVMGKPFAPRSSKPDLLSGGTMAQPKPKQKKPQPPQAPRVQIVHPQAAGKPLPPPVRAGPWVPPAPAPTTSMRGPMMPSHLHQQPPPIYNQSNPPMMPTMPTRPLGGSIPGVPAKPPVPPFAGGPGNRLFDVRLSIRWAGQEQRVLESLRPSIRALQDAAVAYVRMNPGAFDVGNIDLPQGHAYLPQQQVGQPAKPWNLRAIVRQAFFGNDAYDMTNYHGDDLTKLLAVLSVGSIPRFEIDVEQRPVSGVIA